jgi:hypothetical protein
MTLDFHALWTLTGMGTVVFSALAAPTLRSRAAVAAAFAAAVAFGVWIGAPSAEAIGLVTGCGAVLLLLRPATGVVAPVLAGALAGVWGMMLAGQGLPMWLGVGLGATWPVAVIACARSASFAPGRLRDESLFLVMICAVVAAVLPGVQDGWRAAVNLSLQSSQPAATQALPAWTLAVGVSALLLGGLYSLWSRR